MSAFRPAVLAFSLALTGCALEPGRIEGPNWAGPRETWMDDPTPQAAAMNGVSGWALLRCRATAEMRVADCAPIAEAPPGWGFAQAALGMSPQLVLREGSPENGHTLPKPGEYALIPVAFCPQAVSEACRTASRQQSARFSARVRQIAELIESGRCAEAKPAAAALGQPLYTALVDRECAAQDANAAG